MENRSFEGESSSGNPPKDSMDNPPGPSKPRADSSGESKDQAQERIPPLARITDDEDDESPPAYARRYMPQEKERDELEDLGPPPPVPVQEPHDVRLDPEFQQQASRRRARRHMQNLAEGPCSLRPDSPNRPPLPVREPYPDPDRQLQPADASVPGQQVADAPVPGQQVAPACLTTWERCVSYYKRINTFSFQFPFQTLLLTWPLSTAIMGALNSKACKVHSALPYVMAGLGLSSTITILIRLFVLYYEKLFTHARTKNIWIGIRTTEFIIWIVFAVQLYLFFGHSPSFTPGDKNYCKPRFYEINRWLMFLTSVTMTGWIVVNVGNFIWWFKKRNERPNA